MSHVDDGTLHAYLDDELSPLEAHDVEVHVAQCPGCRSRLEEERALIARANELLGLSAPPDRATPPFRPGDHEPPARLWWRVRLPLAWAATVALALGIGAYLGSGASRRERPAAEPRVGDLAAHSALNPPTAVETAAAPRAAPRSVQPARSAPVAPTAVAAESKPAEEVAVPAPAAAARALKTSAAPAASGVVGPYLLPGPPLTLDSARALLGTDPFAVPDLPVRAIYRGRRIGYSGVVVVEQALDSNTTIDVITARQSTLQLQAVVVGEAARADTAHPGEGALLGRVPAADSIATRERRAEAARVRTPGAADRPTTALLLEIRGPLSADSLAALRRRVQPRRP